MSTLPLRRQPRDHERGFILALGLLILGALALIGTAALSSASFQNDLSNNTREAQEVYYAATTGLGRALEQMAAVRPDNVQTLANGNPYLIGGFNGTTGTNYVVGPTCAAMNRSCICPNTVADSRVCVDYYVEATLRKCGKAYGFDTSYATLFYTLSVVATNYSGASTRLSMEVAGIYRAECN